MRYPDWDPFHYLYFVERGEREKETESNDMLERRVPPDPEGAKRKQDLFFVTLEEFVSVHDPRGEDDRLDNYPQ